MASGVWWGRFQWICNYAHRYGAAKNYFCDWRYEADPGTRTDPFIHDTPRDRHNNHNISMESGAL